MKETEQRSDTVWERLRANRERNTHVLAEAGIRPESAGKVICPDCGAEEDVLFWSITGQKGTRLRLLCPICEEARVNFSLATNRAVDPVFTRGSVGGGLGMVAVIAVVAGLFHFRDTPPVQMLVEDVHAARGAVVSRADRATGGLVGSGNHTPPAAPPRSGSGGSSAQPASSGSSGGSTRGTGTSRPSSTSGGSTSGSSPASSSRAVSGSPMPAAEAAASGAAGRVYVSRGDRRNDLDMYAAHIIQRSGAREAGLLLQVQYDPARDVTRVVIDSASVEWPRRLGWLRGWRSE